MSHQIRAERRAVRLAKRWGHGAGSLTTQAGTPASFTDVSVYDTSEANVPVSLAASVSARIIIPRSGAPTTPAVGDKISISRSGTPQDFRLVHLESDEQGQWVFLAAGGR